MTDLAATAKPIAIKLIESGADIRNAARFAAMFAMFLDQNTDAIADAIANGESPDAVIAEALACFKRDALRA